MANIAAIGRSVQLLHIQLHEQMKSFLPTVTVFKVLHETMWFTALECAIIYLFTIVHDIIEVKLLPPFGTF